MASESLSELQAAFDDWRREKKNPRERIPDPLLTRARLAAVEHGVGPVAYRLQVTPGRLTADDDGEAIRPAPCSVPVPAYTRVAIAAPPRAMQPLAEAECPAGVKLRIFLVSPETVGLLSSFCRAGGVL
jgi:hypothetical protein